MVYAHCSYRSRCELRTTLISFLNFKCKVSLISSPTTPPNVFRAMKLCEKKKLIIQFEHLQVYRESVSWTRMQTNGNKRLHTRNKRNKSGKKLLETFASDKHSFADLSYLGIPRIELVFNIFKVGMKLSHASPHQMRANVLN